MSDYKVGSWTWLAMMVDPAHNVWTLAECDAIVRREYDRHSFPEEYRLCRSTAKRALALGIPLCDANGNPRMRESVSLDIGEQQEFNRRLDAAVQRDLALRELGISEQTLEWLVREIRKQLA